MDIKHKDFTQVCSTLHSIRSKDVDKRLVKGTDGYYVTAQKRKITTVEYRKSNTDFTDIYEKWTENFVQCYKCQAYGHLAAKCPKKFKFNMLKNMDEQMKALLSLVFSKRRFPTKVLKIVLEKATTSQQMKNIKKVWKKFNGSQEGLTLINRRWDLVDQDEWNKLTKEKEMFTNYGVHQHIDTLKKEREKKLVIERKEVSYPVQFKKSEYKMVIAAQQYELDKKNYEIAKEVLTKADNEYVKNHLHQAELDTYINFATNAILSDCTSKGTCQNCGYRCNNTCQSIDAIVAPYQKKTWHKNARGKDYYTVDEYTPLQSLKRLLTTSELTNYFENEQAPQTYRARLKENINTKLLTFLPPDIE